MGQETLDALQWLDQKTSLVWTQADNGNHIDWQAAVAYCQELRLGGHNDWRLPTATELDAVYAEHSFDLTSCQPYTSVKGLFSAKWGYNCGAEGSSLPSDDTRGNRALCVRTSSATSNH